jgi:hypothetical protein
MAASSSAASSSAFQPTEQVSASPLDLTAAWAGNSPQPLGNKQDRPPASTTTPQSPNNTGPPDGHEGPRACPMNCSVRINQTGDDWLDFCENHCARAFGHSSDPDCNCLRAHSNTGRINGVLKRPLNVETQGPDSPDTGYTSQPIQALHLSPTGTQGQQTTTISLRLEDRHGDSAAPHEGPQGQHTATLRLAPPTDIDNEPPDPDTESEPDPLDVPCNGRCEQIDRSGYQCNHPCGYEYNHYDTCDCLVDSRHWQGEDNGLALKTKASDRDPKTQCRARRASAIAAAAVALAASAPPSAPAPTTTQQTCSICCQQTCICPPGLHDMFNEMAAAGVDPELMNETIEAATWLQRLSEGGLIGQASD